MGKRISRRDKDTGMRKVAVFFLVLAAVHYATMGYMNAQMKPIKAELCALQTQVDELKDENESLKSTLEEWNVGSFKATFYAPFDNQSGICSDGDPNTTSTGTRPGNGTIAVDPSVIPYYSDMVIVGENWVEFGKALDTGAAMRRNANRIDIYVDTYEEAISRGVQEVIVFWRSSRENKPDLQH